MKKLFVLVKRNWQVAVIAILVVLLFSKQTPTASSSVLQRYGSSLTGEMDLSSSSVKSVLPRTGGGIAPAPDVEDRLVVRNSQLSLLVKDVRQSQKAVVEKAQETGGYMVDSQISSPQGVDSGSVTVRVPENKLDDVLEHFRNLGIRVVSENLVGRDVTDEYVDVQSRLETLYKTKVKFEGILDKAEKIQDILQVQRELVNLQVQIDRLKGQQQYLEKTAQWSKVTVYLSTDELALPYAPTQPWRPKAIFKRATRSLIGTGRSLGTLTIWLGVYSVVWLPVLGVIYFFKRKKKF